MTREEIMQLTGRELDAAVAERVMGWKRGDPKYGDMPWYPPGTGRYLGGGRMNLPEFSTDIAAAWEVVAGLPWPIVLNNIVEGEWGCTVLCYGGGKTHDSDVTVSAPTAPEAICRAALLAVLKRSEAKNGGDGA